VRGENLPVDRRFGAGTCVGETEPDTGDVNPEPTLEETVEMAPLIVLAKVIGRASELWQGIPASLLGIGNEHAVDCRPLTEHIYLCHKVLSRSERIVSARPTRAIRPPADGADVFPFTMPDIHDDLLFPLEGRDTGRSRRMDGSDDRQSEMSSPRPTRTKNDRIERIMEANASGGALRRRPGPIRPGFLLDTAPLGS